MTSTTTNPPTVTLRRIGIAFAVATVCALSFLAGYSTPHHAGQSTIATGTSSAATPQSHSQEFGVDPMSSVPVLVMATVLLLATIAALLCVWQTTIRIIDEESHDARRAFVFDVMMSGIPFRSITVALIVVAVGFLAFFGRLTQEAATLLSGIGGYVLGSLPRAQTLKPNKLTSLPEVSSPTTPSTKA